jgi:leader peptidase (prepilin peptidase)/N-methyltransferase
MVLLSFLFGLVFGSFGNVLIYRIPRKYSISWPASHCPACKTPIRWYDNIPVISWLILKGRCRACGAPIAIRYPLVELLNGILFVCAYARFGVTARSVVAAGFFFVLLVIAAIDIEHRKIPNALVFPATGIAAVILLAQAIGAPSLLPLVGSSEWYLPILAGLAASLSFYALDMIALVVFKKPGIGAGDIKLLFLFGLVLGFYVFEAALIAVVLAAIVGIAVLYIRSKKGSSDSYVPLGPFLSLGAVLTVLYGPQLVSLYLEVAGIS